MATGQLSKTKQEVRILVLTSTFPRWQSDTVPRFVFELARYYVKYGFKVDVIAPHAQGADFYEVMEGISVYRFKYFFEPYQTLAYDGGILANLQKNKLNYLLIPFFILFQAVAIFRRIRKVHYSLIHAHWLIPQAFTSVFISRFMDPKQTPVLCTAHGADLYALNGWVLRKIKQWTAESCTQLCVVSKSMKTYCEEIKLCKREISVLSMGVDLEQLFIPVTTIKRLPNRIIFVGRFVEKKGIHILIRAMAKVIVSVPQAELLLVGDGPLHASINELVTSNQLQKHVIFYGSVANQKLPDLYTSSAIAVVPSIVDRSGDREGLGLVTIEAMGCECAVIASALGPIKEIIDDGKSGMLFTPENSEELALRLKTLLTDVSLRTSIARAGRQKVLVAYDWRKIADDYCSLINSLCR